MKPNKLSLTLALIIFIAIAQALVCTFAQLSPSLLETFGTRFYLWLCLAASFAVPILFLHFYANYWLRKHKYIR